jgi:hypothetical protein
MVIYCVRCGKADPLRKGRNGAPSGSQVVHDKMTGEVRKSFLGTCPKLCRACLSDLWMFVYSPEHRRMFDRNQDIRRAS